MIVGRGSAGEEFLKHSGVAVTLVPVDSADASLELLAQGRYDAALTSRLTGMAIVARSGYRNVLPTGPPIDDLTVSLCFASHDVDRLVQINEGLAILYRTGDYERIYRRWFARYEPTSFTPRGDRALRGGRASSSWPSAPSGCRCTSAASAPAWRSRRASCGRWMPSWRRAAGCAPSARWWAASRTSSTTC